MVIFNPHLANVPILNPPINTKKMEQNGFKMETLVTYGLSQ